MLSWGPDKGPRPPLGSLRGFSVPWTPTGGDLGEPWGEAAGWFVPCGDRKVVAVLPAGVGTSPGNRAKAGAPLGHVPFHPSCLANIPVACEPPPCLAILERAPPAVTGTLRRKRILGEFLCRTLDRDSSALQLLWRDSTEGTNSFKDLCVCSSAA